MKPRAIVSETAEKRGTGTEAIKLAIADIRRDKELNCRGAGVSNATAVAYAEIIHNKGIGVFPAVVVFTDAHGVNWLADGWHRCRAAELLQLAEIPVERHKGTRKDALLYAAGANAEHGRARSPGDKRSAVKKLLAEPTWAKRADNWIAKHAKVSHTFVAKMRGTCNVASDSPRETADGREMDTAKIGGERDPIATALSRFEALLGKVPTDRLPEFRAKVGEALSRAVEP